MRTICLYFEIHQIIHLKRYRFFDIGTDHYYYDDYANETSINDVAERSYIPALNTLIHEAALLTSWLPVINVGIQSGFNEINSFEFPTIVSS